MAIGVLDLLPECVSAKYFLYHESIHKFQPGKLGALYEIALAAEKGYRWWYSGFYIHTCPKMRYKIDFKPQFVLDPETYVWKSLSTDVLELFDEKGYLHLSAPSSPALAAQEAKEGGEMSVDNGPSAASNDADDDDETPLFKSNMPGLPSVELMRRAPLDIIPVRVNAGIISAGDLFDWKHEEVDDPRCAKGMIAALVAAVGPELMMQWALDFRRP